MHSHIPLKNFFYIHVTYFNNLLKSLQMTNANILKLFNAIMSKQPTSTLLTLKSLIYRDLNFI